MEPATFRYMPDDDHGGRGGEDDEETGGGCFLDIYAHEARDVHNICIYGEQDGPGERALELLSPHPARRIAALPPGDRSERDDDDEDDDDQISA